MRASLAFRGVILGWMQWVAAAPSPMHLATSGVGRACKPVEGEVGAAFAMTNAPFNNQVVTFSRSSSGKLTQVGVYSTGGAGQGVEFDSDGGLQLFHQHTNWRPGNGIVHGLIVTNKVGSSLDYYSVDANGQAEGPIKTTQSSGERPFGASLGNDGTIFVIESGLPVLTNAAISTYKPTADGALHPNTKSEKNQQTDGCWVVVTMDNKYAYTANFISGTISSYSVGSGGSVSPGSAEFPL